MSVPLNKYSQWDSAPECHTEKATLVIGAFGRATACTHLSLRLWNSLRRASFLWVWQDWCLGICLPCFWHETLLHSELLSSPCPQGASVCPQMCIVMLLLLLNFWAFCSVATPWISSLHHFLQHRWSSEHSVFSPLWSLHIDLSVSDIALLENIH